MTRIFATLALALAALIPASPSQASVRPSPVVLVQQIAHLNQYVVVLKNGHEWIVPPCRHEDSNNCWWDAERRGNHLGHSFATLAGRVHYTTLNYETFIN